MDEHQLALTRFVRGAALRRFGSARSAPMKPWIRLELGASYG